MTHLILAGFMGTGKSTVGRLLANRLQCQFVDCDAEIERVSAKKITDIFAEDGEGAFRTLETRVLQGLLRREDPIVLALGGGALSSPENLELDKRAGPVICLSADPSVIYQRVKVQAGQRPLLKVAEPLAKIHELLERRQATYAQADVQLDTTTLEPEEVVEEVALCWCRSVSP
jgi:shikimate kinase